MATENRWIVLNQKTTSFQKPHQLLKLLGFYLFGSRIFGAFYAHTTPALSLLDKSCSFCGSLSLVVIYQPVNWWGSLESHTHSGFSQRWLCQLWFELFKKTAITFLDVGFRCNPFYWHTKINKNMFLSWNKFMLSVNCEYWEIFKHVENILCTHSLYFLFGELSHSRTVIVIVLPDTQNTKCYTALIT